MGVAAANAAADAAADAAAANNQDYFFLTPNSWPLDRGL